MRSIVIRAKNWKKKQINPEQGYSGEKKIIREKHRQEHKE
jgi:uncharacterized protein YvpB